MGRYTDLLKQQRQLVPPSGALDQLEQRVMARIDRLPGEQRRRRFAFAGATLCGVVVVVMLVMNRPHPAPLAAPDFVESVVILDNHVCIWLEIPATSTRSEPSHD